MDNKQYQITEPYDGWLDEFVSTREASRITGVPEPTLVTMRSKGGGASYVQPKGTRLIRYARRSLFEWMLSSGLLKCTADKEHFITISQHANEKEGA